jgi:putative hemolysin
MKKHVVESRNLEAVSPMFRGENREWIRKIAMRLFGIDKVNDLYERSCTLKGAEFAESILDDLGVKYIVGNPERLSALPEGAFITVSNHPYGGLDGIMLIDLMAHLRPDYKVMVNQFLSLVEAMNENFISVIPKVGKKSPNPTAVLNSIRETLNRLKEGHPIGFFPAGAVSMYFLSTLSIRDRQWQEGVLKIIQKSNVPVVPIRFFDRNSRFFYFLGAINWRVRLVRMSHELFNKRGKLQRIGIGNLIKPEQISACKNIKELNKLLRKSVYKMPLPENWKTQEDHKSNFEQSLIEKIV